MTIHNDNCLDITKWTSQGIMGSVLEEIRSELTGPDTTPLSPLPDFKKVKAKENHQPIVKPTATPAGPTSTHGSSSFTAMETSNDTSSSSSSEESSDTD